MPLLGCIADDLIGAIELASVLVQHGMPTTTMLGVPKTEEAVPDADAIVVALKSRTAPVRDAVAQSLSALAWLRARGCRQFLFKYGSTFDSTDDGNIGPVADALIDALACGFALACPASPATGQSVYQGHLFVGQHLLHESGIGRNQVREASLVRLLSRQTEGTVGLIDFATVEKGPEAIRRAFMGLKEQGRRYAIVDALSDRHLYEIGEAAATQTLITGGAGIAMGLPENFRNAGLLAPGKDTVALPMLSGPAAVLSGAGARPTLLQIGRASQTFPTLQLDPLTTPEASLLARQALDWAAGQLGATPVLTAPIPITPILITTSAPPERLAALQKSLGSAKADALIEDALAGIAEGLIAHGVRQLIIAGSQTSEAVVNRLGITSLQIGAEIDPGVPWAYARGCGLELRMVLKSGNSATPNFFRKAFDL